MQITELVNRDAPHGKPPQSVLDLAQEFSRKLEPLRAVFRPWLDLQDGLHEVITQPQKYDPERRLALLAELVNPQPCNASTLAALLLATSDASNAPDFPTACKIIARRLTAYRREDLYFNRAVAYHRREFPETLLALPEDAPSPLELVTSSEPDPCEVVAIVDAVERLLARFGKRTANLLRLMMEGRTAAEAARMLGISEGTAWKLIERARKKLLRDL